MADDAPTQRGFARQAAIGAGVAAWAFLDPLVALVVVGLAAWTRPVVVFGVAAVVLAIINLAACNWLDRQWAVWVSGHGERLEKRLEKMRNGRIMRHPVAWIASGSAFWFTLAAILVNAVVAVGCARIISGQPVGERRIRLAAITFSVFIAAFYAVVGWAVGDTIRAV